MYQHLFRYFVTGWSFDPIALGAIAVGALLYFRGERSLQRARRSGSGIRLGSLRSERYYFVASLVLLIIAFDSPIDSYSEMYFWVHMIQHIILMVVAPPLLVLSDPWLKSLRGLPKGIRPQVGRAVSRCVRSTAGRRFAAIFGSLWAANILMNASMWFWHYPAMYDLTLRNLGVHYVEHFCFFSFGVFFFYRVIDPNPYRVHVHAIRKVGHLWLSAMSSMILAMLLGLSSGVWYTFYAHVPGRTLSLLADQQLGAGLMWVFGGLPFFFAGVTILKDWLDQEELKDEDGLNAVIKGLVTRSVGRERYTHQEVSSMNERVG